MESRRSRYAAVGLAAALLAGFILAGCVEHVDVHLFDKSAAPVVQAAPDGAPCVKWPALASDARQWLDKQTSAPASLGAYFAAVAALQGTIKDCPTED